MQKVAVVAHRSQKEELVEFLHQEGVMQLTDLKPLGTFEHTEVHFQAAELDFAIEKLRPLASKETLSASEKKPTEDQVVKAAFHTDIRGIIDQVHALEKEDAELKKEMSSLGKQQLTMDADASAAEEGAYFTATNVRSDLSHFGGATAVAGGDDAEQVKLRGAELQKKMDDNRAKMAKLSAELPNLIRARIYLAWLDQKQAAREAMKETRSTVTLFGWIAKNMFEPLEKKLQKVSPATAVVAVEAGPDEQAPVLLKNPKWMKPFESVTTLYGLPQASEVDPTPLLAPFFILFFGLCLTDAGYGLVLAAIMGIYLFITKKSIEEAKLWWLLFFGGIFTFLVSIPFGGWFGLAPAQVQGFLPSAVVDTNADGVADLFKGQIWNLGETKGITFFQNLALALGVIHLSFGIFMSGYVKWRAGNKAEALWADWTTLLLFAVIGSYFLVPADQQQNVLYGIYASALLVLWGKGYGSKWYVRPLTGLLGIINLAMSMLSNTLSYLRLLALGLVTGALALAVNLVAQQIGALFPIFIGLPIAIIIYVLGHTVNLALNTLGAFIHSGRLQFVEFFGNFFEGGGQPFEPYKRSVSHNS